MKLGRRGLSALMVGAAMTVLVVLTAAFAAHLKDVRGVAADRPLAPAALDSETAAAPSPEGTGRTAVHAVTVATGDTLMKLLVTAGSDRRAARTAVAALGKRYNLRRLRVGREVIVVFDRPDSARPRLAAVSLEVGNDSYVVAGRDRDGGFTAKPAREPLDAALVAAPPLKVTFEPEPHDAVRNSLRLRDGDTLMDALLRAGCERADAYAAIAALRQLYDPRKLRAGQMLTVVLASHEADRRPVLHGISFAAAPGRSVEVGRAEGGGFTAREVEVSLERGLAHASGRIESSLYQAAAKAGVPSPIMMEMIRAFSFDVDFQREIRRGDRFEVLFERFHDDYGEVVSEGDLLYAALKLGGQTMKIYRHTTRGGGNDFYNENGQSVRKALLRTPIDGARLSSRYGKRKHPILGYTKMHRGVDFAANRGVPVVSAGDGVIERIGWNGSYGRYIRIRHKGSYATAYAHLSSFAKGLRKGRRVKQGQMIGRVGKSGLSTGPHLHYEVLQRGRQINPLKVKLPPTGAKLTGLKLTAFKAARGKIEDQLAALLRVRRGVADGRVGPGGCGAGGRPVGMIAALGEDQPARC